MSNVKSIKSVIKSIGFKFEDIKSSKNKENNMNIGDSNGRIN